MSPTASGDVNTELNNAGFLDIVEITRIHHRYDLLDTFIIDI